MKKYDVVIVGAGTSGLTARREVAKKTENYLVVDDGPLGTTCARVGCMPSKVLIQAANDFHRLQVLPQMGVQGLDQASIDGKKVMSHVRSLRDRFVRGVRSSMEAWEETHLKRERATIVGPHELKIGEELVGADKIILGPGSSPNLPENWKAYSDFLVDTNQVFEWEDLPQSLAVVGLGVIGLELGQAFSRLGVNVVGISHGRSLGGLSDPQLQDYVISKFEKELPLYLSGGNPVGRSSTGLLQIEVEGRTLEVEKVLMAAGRSPNLKTMGIENLKVPLERGLPKVDPNTLALIDAPHIFLPGDANGDRAILHEAADEGFIAGYNAVQEKQCFRRRVFLGITFSDPNIATVGQSYSALKSKSKNFVTGEVSFEGQGRSIVKLKEQGRLHVYVDKESHHILGAELQAPDGEHLAHLLSWAISLNLTVFETLSLPFYHPVLEEGLRTALRSAGNQLEITDKPFELSRCQDSPIR